MYDNVVANVCDLIRKDFKPKKSRWHIIGYRNGRKVWMSESNLRIASVDEICSDKSLSAFRRRRYFRRR